MRQTNAHSVKLWGIAAVCSLASPFCGNRKLVWDTKQTSPGQSQWLKLRNPRESEAKILTNYRVQPISRASSSLPCVFNCSSALSFTPAPVSSLCTCLTLALDWICLGLSITVSPPPYLPWGRGTGCTESQKPRVWGCSANSNWVTLGSTIPLSLSGKWELGRMTSSPPQP